MTKTELAILTHLLIIEDMLLPQCKHLMSEEQKQKILATAFETAKLIIEEGGDKI